MDIEQGQSHKVTMYDKTSVTHITIKMLVNVEFLTCITTPCITQPILQHNNNIYKYIDANYTSKNINKYIFKKKFASVATK